ncbi:MAG: ATP-binding protein [Eggerthellaceae bacterium]|nr:ATP-binding protein [Eggerthellaceae bacterium]
MASIPLFHPTFGSRPAQIVGRDRELDDLISGLRQPIGSRDRCTLMLGQRGMGKTALLLEFEDRAVRQNFVVARVSHNEDMLSEIIELIQINGAQYIDEKKKPVAGFNAGALGFSFGLTFTEETQRSYGFRVKLGLLCDKLAEHGKGVLILVDEAQTSDKMRQLATTYQNLVGDGKNIAIGMAGLPHAVSSILNDNVLTFLNRARKMRLRPISTQEIRAYYANAFISLGITCPDGLLDEAAASAKGFPYLMQLVGYYLVRYTEETRTVTNAVLAQAEKSARADMEENVFAPILAPLSDRDRDLLDAMAQDKGVSKVSDLIARLGTSDSSFQPYRARLIESGVIESPQRGKLEFAVPFLADYLRREARSDE